MIRWSVFASVSKPDSVAAYSSTASEVSINRVLRPTNGSPAWFCKSNDDEPVAITASPGTSSTISLSFNPISGMCCASSIAKRLTP